MRHYFLLIVIIFTAACSSSKNDSQAQGNNDTLGHDTTASTGNDQFRVFSLPAPLQIPTEIKKHNSKYYEDLLQPTRSNPEKLGTSFKKALNLGVYAVDLGYATVYEQRQAAINYLDAAMNLAKQLNIKSSIDKNIIERFKANINNKDTVNRIIIKSFSDINRELSESNQQSIVGVIMTGSFVEGVHLSTGIYLKNKSEDMLKVIGQQKIFLENLISFLSEYQTEEYLKLIAELTEVKTAYDALEIKYTETNDKNVQLIETVNGSEEQIKLLQEKINAIRQNIVM